jgi:peroxin-5
MHKRLDMNAEEGVNVSSNLWEMLRKTFMMMVRQFSICFLMMH